MFHLSLIFPCFNEEENLLPLVEAVTAAFDGCGFAYELVFVDDGSHDATFATLRQLQADANVPMQALRFSRNFGKESAIYAGLQHARGDFVTLIDADLQQPPAIALEMLRFLEANPDYDCVAARQTQRGEGKLISFLKGGFYWLMNRLTEVEFVQGASDFRTMRRSMAEAVLALSERNRFSKGIFSWVGFHTHYIPYTAQARHAGTSKWGTLKLFRYAFDGIVSFTTLPLRLAVFAGVLSALGSLIYMLVIVVQKLAFAIVVKGWATLAVLILFLGGMQLLALGILGEYMAKSYMETKRRPVFLLREHLIAPGDLPKEEALQ